MKFLIDAQLPYRLKLWLAANSCDAIHTNDLPARNLTADTAIADIADQENRIVITKDGDFLKLKILHDKPEKLLILTTGNIVNKELLALFERNFQIIQKLFNSYDTVEMNNNFVIGHNLK